MLDRRIFYALVCLVLCAFEVHAQCPNDNTLNQILTEPTPGNSTAACCVWGGEYITMTVTTGTTYRIETCGGPADDTFLSLYNDTGGSALGFNDNSCGLHASVDYLASFTGTVRILVDINSTCGSNALNHPTTVTNLGSLPVTWGAFSGEIQDGAVQLTWETLLERESNYFEVERASDGINYSSIGQVPANNLKSQSQTYDLIDHSPQKGANFYRVKEVSLNGETSYHSNVLEIGMDHAQELQLSNLFPSPASDRLHLELVSQSDLPLDIRMFDLLGREVRQLNVEGQAQTDLEMDLAGLKSGNYILSVQQGTNLLRKKVTVLQ